ncbi:DUF934 domain-containing protein [Gilvimarinus polysaccharolyticus]|uniref:DUF934 domain-containing protein n=1 Tax=Gilvimarinus polysaccharolyticus TaxID=863921 RepID=UPI0006733111|nr:DUF934 domain-containing protein [Gilvimarinus polysaccharolyticus]
MPKLVKDGVIVDDQWQVLPKPEADESLNVPAGQFIVPLSVWLAQQDKLQARDDIGVWLDADEAAEQIGAKANTLPVIAVNFPTFMDGRAFSTARLLRERFGFTGELRAIGDFMRDQLCYLSRCGVNAFQFADAELDLTEEVKSLNDFTEYYQACVNQPIPLFRRRNP